MNQKNFTHNLKATKVSAKRYAKAADGIEMGCA